MGTQFTDGGAVNGTLYHYTAFAYDNSGNYSEGVSDTCTAHQASAVLITDENLEMLIRTELGIPSGDITDLQMLQLTELDANGQAIADLQGIQHATNLTRLELNSNSLGNDSNLQLLAQLTNLQRLTLMENGFTIIPEFNGMSIFNQVLAADSQANPLGLVTSPMAQFNFLAPFKSVPISMVYLANLGTTGTVEAQQGLIARFD